MIITLSHQLLLLELLVVSGDIAVANAHGGTILARTLEQCCKAGWVSVQQMGGFRTYGITETGRTMAATDKGRST